MQAILHIGTEKTGSTSIQSFLATNRSRLLEQGVALLDSIGKQNNRYLATYSMEDGRTDETHAVLGLSNQNARDKWRRRMRADLRSEIRSLPKSVRLVILSSEHCHSRLISKREIEHLKELLAPMFENIKILVYLRRQDEVAVSLYSTAMKVGYTYKSIIPERDIKYHYYDYECLLERWGDVFGEDNIIPRLYRKENMKDAGVIQDFCEVCDLKGVDIPCAEASENRSLNALAQEFLRHFNMTLADDPLDRQNVMRGLVIRFLEEKYAGIPRMPRRQVAESFYLKFRDANNRIAERWFSSNQLFDENFSCYPENVPEEDYGFEDAVEVAAYLCKRLMEINAVEERVNSNWHVKVLARHARKYFRKF